MEDPEGDVCEVCGGEATHWYWGVDICCECHLKMGEEETRRQSEAYKSNPLIEVIPLDDPPIMSEEDKEALRRLVDELSSSSP